MSGKKHRPARRVDYWDDPAAPKPTSHKPSASVIVRNHTGDLLLLRRPDSGRWTIPTGGLKKNETLTQCAIRECREETGVEIEIISQNHPTRGLALPRLGLRSCPIYSLRIVLGPVPWIM